ncbi:MAG: glycosyltransferase family 9 protein [Candidatus Thorarchaeota archaeon]
MKEFYEKRNKILIVRETGGLGDILMHRMMFEDFKLLIPDAHIVFATPTKYHDALYDHPFIDELVDSKTLDIHDYVVSYNTTSACTRYEMRMFPFSGKNRSDIWANHCGVKLSKHNMHISLEDKYKQFGLDFIKNAREGCSGPAVCLAPITAMTVKNFTNSQLEGTVAGLRERGCFVYATHYVSLPLLKELNVPQVFNASIRQWMGAISAADHVISMDSAAFHYAGGIGKPLVGIFTFADGKVYGKHYDFTLVQKHRDDGNWDCGPCYNWAMCAKSNTVPKPCLLEITPDMILRGYDEMVRKSSSL